MRLFDSQRLGSTIVRLVLIVWFCLMAVLAVASFTKGSAVYGSWWFIGLWGLVAAGIAAATPSKFLPHVPSLMLHASFVLILSGGFLTYLLGESAIVKLRPGELATQALMHNGKTLTLPKPITLISFDTDYYPGAAVPRNYTSTLSVDGKEVKISVNHPYRLKSFTFYQNSYTADGASIIQINHDPIGRDLSFAGYILFALGGLLCLVSRKGRYRSIIRKLGAAALLFLAPTQAAGASAYTDTLQVVYNGRVAPVSTPAREFFTKVSGTTSVCSLSPEEAFISLKQHPQEWKNKKFILIESDALRRALGLEGKYASLADMFADDGEYKLQALYRQQTLTDAILKADEKVELVHRLVNGDLVSPLPAGVNQLPAWRANAERMYYRVPFTKIFFICAISVAAIMLLSLDLKRKIGNRLSVAFTLTLLLLQAVNYGLMWVCAGRVPLDNSAQTLLFISLGFLALALLPKMRQSTATVSLAILLSGFAALVSYLSQSNPSITAAVPVLSSPWLGIHVSLVMTAYTLLAFSGLVSGVSLCLRRDSALALALLFPAVYLLGLGIFTGAVWASVAWGRYWGWDPKETWALITFMAYAVPLHRSVPFLKSPRHLHIYNVAAISTLLMTYFGVNYLGGLHSY